MSPPRPADGEPVDIVSPPAVDRAASATGVSMLLTDPSRPDNPVVWVNPAFTATTGYTAEETIGQNCRFLQGDGTDPGAIADMGRSLTEQRSITTTLLNYRKDGTPFWNEVAISPVRDDAGQVTHFVGVQTDVTARVQAQQARDEALRRAELAAGRLALLADFSTRLTGSLENADILGALMDVLVLRLGTWCAVHLADRSLLGSRSVVRHARASEPRIAAALAELRASLELDGLPPDSPTTLVLRGELPHVLVPDVAAAPRAAGVLDDPRSQAAGVLGTRSLLVVPLRSRARVLGCVAVLADDSRRPFDDDDLALARELAARTALMLENSALYTRERATAETLQRSMMPAVPQLSGLTMAARYLTASDEAAVGGDWYDVFALRAGGVGIAVGDAMGHNIDSVAAMGKLSTVLRAYAWPGGPAGEALGAVDELLAGTRQQVLATCCYGRLWLQAGGAIFEYANAGHPPALLRRPDGTVEILGEGRAAMLGVLALQRDATPARPNARVEVASGSMLVLYTDGLTDSVAPELDPSAAVTRVAALVAEQPPGATPRQVVRALAGQAQGGRTDDVVVLAVRID